MTKRLTTALLCVLAAFAIGGVATAQAKVLSYRTAKGLAKRLAEKQVRGRDVISFHLLLPDRVSPTRIVFQYDDRTADNVFCTALVIIDSRTSGRTTTISARFTGQDCNGIPSEVLKFEAATRQAQRALRRNTAATLDALSSVRRSARRCRSVQVPRRSADDAQSLFDIAVVEALEGPNDAIVGDFSTALTNVNASNATLRAGAAGWVDYIATIRALPQIADPCAELKRWARAGYASDAAPIDFAAYRALNRRAGVDRRAIRRASNLMAARGVFPNAALGFTPDGLLLQLGAKAGITGGKGKLGVAAKALLG
jgi:hypothetical protein